MKTTITKLLVESWAKSQGNVNTNEDIIQWIQELNQNIKVSLKKVPLTACRDWYYDEEVGEIRHVNNIFFQITGMRQTLDGESLIPQPVVLQHGIGYLGIICKEINGVLNFLMQAKIEPGNVNRIQLSPTLQATLSNFTQRHGGKKPPYLDYFQSADKYEIIFDQIQSEQSSRFYKKRNRNIIIKIDEDIEILPMFRWMTIGQIKRLMRLDNIVNMDTRTVLSGIPFFQSMPDASLFTDQAFFRSVFNDIPFNFPEIYYYINNYKMQHRLITEFIPLQKLANWHMKDGEFVCDDPSNYKIIFCDINIEGREVVHWQQPLIEAIGQATFGLLTCVEGGIRKFLVHAKHEIGIFDYLEFGPTVQLEPLYDEKDITIIERLFLDKLISRNGVLCDTILSEEGGRFYQEQNRNIIIDVDRSMLPTISEGYLLLDYKTLNLLTQFNNCLNIQLRNLLSLLEV